MPLTSIANTPNRARKIVELLATLLIIVGLFIFWNISPRILLLPVLVLLAPAQLLSEKLGRNLTAILFIGITLTLATAAAVERATVELCLLVACFNSLALFRARSAFVPDSPMSNFIRALLKIWCAMAVVSGAVWTLSYWLGHIPLENLLDWAERLESAELFLKKAEKISTVLLVSLIVFYFVAWRWNAVHDGYARTWRGIIFSRQVLDNASLLLACLTAFSFIAGQTSDGPGEKLTEARARALSDDYRDVVWTVELAIRRHAILQIANETLAASPPSVKAGIADENALLAHPTPGMYFIENHARLTADDLATAGGPQTARAEAFRRTAQESLARERRNREYISPPRGVNRRQLDSTKAEARDLDRSEDRPYWLSDAGWEALEQTVELGVSADRISLLSLIAEQMPLAGKLIETAFDAVNESVMTKIRRFAVQVVDHRLEGGSANLRDEVKYAAETARRQVVLHSLEPEDWTAIEVRTHSKKEAANRAFEAFRRDWFAAVASETRNLAKLARTGDAKDLRMLFAAVGYAPCPEDAHPGGRDK